MSFEDPQIRIFVIIGMVFLYNAIESIIDGGKAGINYMQIYYKVSSIVLTILITEFLLYKLGYDGFIFKRKKKEVKDEVKFSDVAGLQSAKQEMREVAEYLKNPAKYLHIGAKLPKGILLTGPPGNGKTYLARAIAGEARVNFINISGSSFIEKYVGVGASRMRELFAKAVEEAPSLVFIDEIDSIGGKRRSDSGADTEYNSTLNELLVAMDGFTPTTNVIVIGSTNREDMLDPALLRRFERRMHIGNPDLSERLDAIKILTKELKLSDSVDLSVVAKQTAGSSTASLKTLSNEAGLLAVRNGHEKVEQSDFSEAIDRVFLGLEKKDTIMTAEEKLTTAYHEAGHAVAAYYTPNSDPIHKVTIVPRGQALGFVAQLPKDNVHISKEKLKSKLIVAAAGRVAEIIKFGEDKVTMGPASDIEYSTNLARKMFVSWGLSKELGPVNYDSDDVSGAYREKVDKEIKECIEDASEKARSILIKHSDKWELLANRLMEVETMNGDDVKDLFTNE